MLHAVCSEEQIWYGKFLPIGRLGEPRYVPQQEKGNKQKIVSKLVEREGTAGGIRATERSLYYEYLSVVY